MTQHRPYNRVEEKRRLAEAERQLYENHSRWETGADSLPISPTDTDNFEFRLYSSPQACQLYLDFERADD